MKYFQNLLLLGIIFLTILFGQSIEIPHRMMSMQDSINIPIFIYDVSELESIDLTIKYDDSIVLINNIIDNPLGILIDGDYTFTTNITQPGIIDLVIVCISENVSSAHGMVAQINFKSIGNLGEISSLIFLDAQINSNWEIPVVDGSIEIVLDNLTITAVDQSGVGSDDSITLGMCETCTDGWKYGEDEYDIPNPPSGAYTDIYFFNKDWYNQQDENGNICDQYKFINDYRQQHSATQLVSWGISGSTSGLSSDTPIILNWVSSNSDNFKIFLYVGDEDGVDMQEQNSITISQSDLSLDENIEPNIWVRMGNCVDTGETITYYQDYDGDGLGSSVESEFCEGMQPEGWVETNDGDTCDGDEDCLGACGGYAITDECGVCDLFHDNNNQCYDCNFEPNGQAILDNCGNCILEGENITCEMDCTGAWGGSAIHDDCDICEGNQIDGDKDEDGDICETACTEELDCFGVCGGSATTDDCNICVGGTTGLDPCIPDCFGIPGGNAYSDECGVCDSNTKNDNEQCLDCNFVPNGDSVLDNCGTCDNNISNDCIMDCNGEWGGSAIIDVNCDICIGGTTGLEPCSLDCNGVWGGYAFTDDCGVCDSDNTNNNQCADCTGEIYGEAIVDNCNECILAGEISSCVQGCNGIWNNNGSEVKYDECGVCGGNNSSCKDCFGKINGEAWINACGECVPLSDTSCSTDCAGIPNGNSVVDNCGTCDNNVSNDCVLDCHGDWGGEAIIDQNCGTCIGGATGLEPCILDCNGIWGGNYENDLCGICDADSENDNQCVDCNGTVDGLAKLDDCLNCVEDLSDSNYECEQDCNGVWGGNYQPTFTCQNGDIACNYDACFELANNELQLPQRFDISRIYPNPFNPQANIDFEVSKPTMVQLNIYNLNGQKVEMLKNAFILPGYYSVIWNGTNHPSGIYFVILESSNSIVKQKMMLIK